MNAKWVAVLAFLVLVLVLTGVGLVGSKYAFSHYDRLLSEASPQSSGVGEESQAGMSEKDYKKIRLAFNAFDLAAGLTRADFDALPSFNTHAFATLWLCVGAVFFVGKPRKKNRD
ncbi:MAG: hypothetical protein ACUVRZ_05750 [Desulfobacca sp.]|uniref:hypothetical protein n=1 Tax=Desulfobacca sp. TaxID=2067990 RepID=UPI00404AF7D5